MDVWPPSMRLWASRGSAVPDASASRQPVRPQLHTGPSDSNAMCPISPATPDFPW